MPRKGPAPKRPLVVDPVYGSQLVTQLVSKVLQDGKKAVAQRIVYTALEGCREKTGTDPVVTLKRALDNIRPTLEVKSRRVGGATYQVPIEVRATRQTTLGLRWLVSYAGQRRAHVVHRPLQRDDGVGAGLLARALQGRVDDALGQAALAVLEDLVHQLGDQRRAEDRVGDQRTLRSGSLAGHQLFSFFAP